MVIYSNRKIKIKINSNCNKFHLDTIDPIPDILKTLNPRGRRL